MKIKDCPLTMEFSIFKYYIRDTLIESVFRRCIVSELVSVCLSSDNLLTTIFNKCFVITSILSFASMCLIVCLLRDGCKCICVRETADK